MTALIKVLFQSDVGYEKGKTESCFSWQALIQLCLNFYWNSWDSFDPASPVASVSERLMFTELKYFQLQTWDLADLGLIVVCDNASLFVKCSM